jgi:hypothetical protein
MARSRAAHATNAKAAREADLAIGPGLHAGLVVRLVTASEDSETRTIYQVRLLTGRQVKATLGPGVVAALVDECSREGRNVVLMDGPHGPLIAGALQTAPYPVPDARGTLALEARHLRLRATETLELEVPGSSLRIEPGGAVRLEGDRLVIDMAALVRIFSGRVEIP